MKIRTKSTPLGGYYMERPAHLIQPRSPSQDAQEVAIDPTESEGCQKSSQDLMASMSVTTLIHDYQPKTSAIDKEQQEKYCPDILIEEPIREVCLESLYSEPQIVAICNFCRKSFPDELDCQGHVQREHAPGILTFSRSEDNTPVVSPTIVGQENYCPSCTQGPYHMHKLVHTPSKAKNNDMRHCELCNYTYDTVYGLQAHFQRAHKDHPRRWKTDFYCEVCDMYYLTLPKFKLHRHIKHRNSRVKVKKHQTKVGHAPNVSNRNFYCQPCEKRYTSRFDYHIHVQIKHSKLHKPPPKSNAKLTRSYFRNSEYISSDSWFCPRCDKKFDSEGQYKTHIVLIQRNSLCERDKTLPPKYCDVCELTFRNDLGVMIHINDKHKDHPARRKTKFHCQECDIYFVREAFFTKHRSAKHTLPTRSGRRTLPSIVASSPTVDHTFKVEDTSTKVENLSMVDSSSSSNQSLKVEDSSFFCKHCNNVFMSKYFIDRHLMTEHRIKQQQRIRPIKKAFSVVRPDYTCSPCKHQYANVSSFNAHVRRRHPLQLSSERSMKQVPSTQYKKETLNIDTLNSFNSPDKAHTNSLSSRQKSKLVSSTRSNHLKDAVSFSKNDDINAKKKYKRGAILKRGTNPTVQPDMDNPDNYCAPCRLTYSSRMIYLIHLEQTHNMEQNSDRSLEDDASDLTFSPSSNSVSGDFIIETHPETAANHRRQSSSTSISEALHSDCASEDIALPTKSIIDVPSTKVDKSTTTKQKEQRSPTLTTDAEKYIGHASSDITLPIQLGLNNEISKADQTTQPTLPDSPTSLKITDDKSNFDCPSCRMTLSNQTSFNIHVTEVHRLKLQEIRPKVVIRTLTDPTRRENDSDSARQYGPDVGPSTVEKIQIPKRSRQLSDPKMKPIMAKTSNTSNLNCVPCNVRFSSQSSLNNHFTKVHEIAAPKRQKISRKLMSCEVCNVTNIYKSSYIRHLKANHGIIQKALVLFCRPNNNIQPDSVDPTTVYCRSCHYTFGSTNIYRKHLIDLHNIDLKPMSEDDATIFGWHEMENNQFVYCKICERTFINHRCFLSHMNVFHDVDMKNKEPVSQPVL